MKLELVMLTTVISFITERLVEAELKCYKKPDLTGPHFEIKDSTRDITSKVPNGPRACIVYKSSWIFYSKAQFLGDINTIHTDGNEVYKPSSNFTVTSMLRLKLSHKEGIFLFRKKYFQGGVFQYFFEEVEKVTGINTYESAVVMGETLDWTTARRCNKSECERICLSCLKRAKSGSGASFIRTIDSTGLWQILTILPGACLGKHYTGVPRINDCKCNVHGLKKGYIGCDSEGDCRCGPDYTGKICDQCINGKYKVGHVCKRCNCYGYGMTGNCDPIGKCYCFDGYYKNGDKCNMKGCNCKGPGVTGACNKHTGFCYCDAGYYENGGRCLSCNCKGLGMSIYCGRFSGECYCIKGYYKNGDKCNICNCKGPGTTGECDRHTGECYCTSAYYSVGRRCLSRWG